MGPTRVRGYCYQLRVDCARFELVKCTDAKLTDSCLRVNFQAIGNDAQLPEKRETYFNPKLVRVRQIVFMTS